MNKTVTKIKSLLKQAQDLAQDELGLENIFYNERFVELMIANELGHEYGNNTQGGDAWDPVKKKPVEYKAINLRSKGKGTFQFHWLSQNKINQYSQTEDMYFCIRDGVQIKEIYRVPTKTVIPYLKEKSTGGKSIHGHWGTNKDKLINELKAEKCV